MQWIKITDLLIPEGDFIRLVELRGKKYVFISNSGSFYLTQARCPHAGADLSRGWCKEGKLVCPFHRYEFDLSTGRTDPEHAEYIDLYPVKKEEDGFYAGFPEQRSLWKMLFWG